MSVEGLTRRLTGDPAFRDRIAHIEVLPSREPRYGELTEPFPPSLERFCERRGIRLYTHQCESVETIRRGEHLLLTTATASGKTLAFNLPVFERLIRDPEATALYLYPTKALANDQLRAVRLLEQEAAAGTRPAIYDGDTPTHRRPDIRSRSRLILSNPYELHQILPWHYKWAGFLRHLNFVVIDEAHRYRGVFGSHIAFLFRRLRRLCAFYGASPQFILASATLANPREFSRRLTGLDCTLVDGDGSPRGRGRFILYNPYFDGDGTRSVHQETKEVFVASVREDLQTLCFTSSRRMTELISRWAREALRSTRPGREDTITAYRAGYLPEERRAIEQRLKDGRVRGVVSTNALELGVDIGGMDAVVLSGFPGTLISTWQQAGRAGRTSADSVAILVGYQNPLDQYFLRHPRYFFGRSMEHAIVDEANPYIRGGQLLCAAAELPLNPETDAQLFGPDVEEMLRSFQDRHLVRETPRGWIYAGRGRAVDAVALEGSCGETFRVTCEGRLLETLDRVHAFREGHPGAVLLHGGDTYLVRDLDLEGRVVRVKKTDVDYYTEPIRSVDISILGESRTTRYGDLSLSLGPVEVVERYTGYRTIRHHSVVGIEPLTLPPLRFETEALWFTVPESCVAEVERTGRDVAGGLHGMEHALIGMMPFHVMCDRWDIGGLSTPCFPSTGRPTVFIYDGCEGGIGLSEKGYELFPSLVGTARDLVAGCPCEAGCPGCIYSPKCGNDNRPLDKEAVRILLREVHRLMAE